MPPPPCNVFPRAAFPPSLPLPQSALFNFQSLLTVILLFICTCAYLRPKIGWLDRNKTGLSGMFWKAARWGLGVA